MTALRVLSLNVGSSSLKLALWQMAGEETRLASGSLTALGSPKPRLTVRDATGAVLHDETRPDARDAATAALAVLEALDRARLPSPSAVGHRLVHGGPDLEAPVRIDADVVARLEALVPFAPLHLPGEIAVIRAIGERLPALPQVACFDTAFHRRMPEVAQRLPLPRALWDEGVRRYGFHGLSYEYVVGTLPDGARGRTVIAHLGNGASLAAVRDGIPVDTTMGFTPTGGLMMGTRPGDLDPGVLLHLVRTKGWDADALGRLIEERSGLRGVSGSTSDVATLLERRAQDRAAADAIDLFCWIARKHVAAMAASLGGLDTLVFTGGIGEHAAPVRAEICAGLAHLGVTLDPRANDAHAAVVSAADSACTVRVVATDEERTIARHTRDLLA